MTLAAPARRPTFVTVETHALVERLMECIALASFASSAVGAAYCPHTTGPVSEARNALSKLDDLLKAEAGYWDRLGEAA